MDLPLLAARDEIAVQLALNGSLWERIDWADVAISGVVGAFSPCFGYLNTEQKMEAFLNSLVA